MATRNTSVEGNILEQIWQVETDDILEGVDILLKDNYVAAFGRSTNGITMKFLNGQSYKISVEEIK